MKHFRLSQPVVCLWQWVEAEPGVESTVPLPFGANSHFQPGAGSDRAVVMIRNEVFSCFVFYAVLLVIKMYTIAVITGQVRLRKKAFANPEDALRHGGLEFHREDPYVERCRRAHLNDLENILPFLFLGAVYSLTGPSLSVARLHFIVFFLARVLHSLAYLLALKAPTRSLAYTAAQIPCVSMAVQILMSVSSYA